MIKIDFKTFVFDRQWFGWWYVGSATGWMREPYERWSIINLKVNGKWLR